MLALVTVIKSYNVWPVLVLVVFVKGKVRLGCRPVLDPRGCRQMLKCLSKVKMRAPVAIIVEDTGVENRINYFVLLRLCIIAAVSPRGLFLKPR